MRRFFPFFLTFAIVLGAVAPGLGYRALWADELETAERARSILDSGVPKVFDSAGNLSLNAGGREIEESDLHRYTPWLQFYTAAAGLSLGRAVGLSPDASVRVPFVILHALTSGLVAQGLIVGLSLAPLPAVAIGAAYGIGSVRLLHARTARYHALADFLMMLAWCLFAVFRRKRTLLPAIALGITLVALLHTQSIIGMLALFVFGSLFLFEARLSRPTFFFAGILALGLIAFALLVRPWEQSAIWGTFTYRKAHGLKSWFETAYPISFFVGSFFLLSGFRTNPHRGDGWVHEFRLAAILLLTMTVGVRILDNHPFSQIRYYLPTIGLFLFWPIAIGGPTFAASVSARRAFIVSFFAIFLFAEASPGIGFFQGLKVVAFDSRSDLPAPPLRDAAAYLRSNAPPGSGILVDYVPQFVNWYLPDYRPALLPDPTLVSSLGRKNPAIPPMVEPEWDLYYPRRLAGFWACEDHCDFQRSGNPRTSERYWLRSRALGKTFEFCIVRRWMTHRWNGAPFLSYLPEALHPEGLANEELTLARRCPETSLQVGQ